MKYLFTFLCVLCLLYGQAAPSAFNKLAEVNACWKTQPEAVLKELPQYRTMPEKEWIRLHLSLVEAILRRNTPRHLSAAQAALRSQSLDHLRRYWQEGNFPVNERYSYRTPIFIDGQDNFCAVGYLVKASGFESISRMIASRTNLAYVKDMHYPELDQWAITHGFTKDELAWIQPGYPPAHTAMSPVGKGVEGKVLEMATGQAGERLYVGGAFDKADGTIPSSNIAYVTSSAPGQYEWHALKSGTNGPVTAIAEYDGKLFAGGTFSMAGEAPVSNIAYWDGSDWHAAGCVDGRVSDMIVFQGSLYIAGSFDGCDGSGEINFARWNGSGWTWIAGLSGQVNTLEVMGDRLLLGGRFSYQGNPANVISWSPLAVPGFQTFDNTIRNEVMDFEPFGGAMYAVCRRTHETDSLSLMLKLDGNEWASLFQDATTFPFFTTDGSAVALNTLITEENTLLAGGSFLSAPDMMVFTANCVDVTPAPYQPGTHYFFVDSSIHKLIWYKGDLIAGGSFRHGWAGSGEPLNGIARRKLLTTHIGTPAGKEKVQVRIAPNPVPSGGTVMLDSKGLAGRFYLSDLSGRKVFSGSLDGKGSSHLIRLPELNAGMYLLEVQYASGASGNCKLLVQ